MSAEFAKKSHSYSFSDPRDVSLPFAHPLALQAGEVPLIWARNYKNQRYPLLVLDAKGQTQWKVPIVEVLEACRQMTGREPKRPLYTLFPGFDVYRVPAFLRKFCLKSFFLGQEVEASEPNGSGIDRLLQQLEVLKVDAPELKQFRAPLWPNGKRAAFVITLDVDSNFVFRQPDNGIRRALDARDLKAAWYFVTGRYPLEHDFLSELERQGHEIGWHTHFHDHSLAFLSRPKIQKIVSKALPFLEKYDVAGMRCDNFLWSRNLFEVMSAYLKYDTSFNDAYPVCERGFGCETSRPFKMESGLWQIPTTLSVDLFFPDTWSLQKKENLVKAQIDQIISVGGVVHLLIHPEPSISLAEPNLTLLHKVLDYIELRKAELWHARPRDIQQYVATQGTAEKSTRHHRSVPRAELELSVP